MARTSRAAELARQEAERVEAEENAAVTDEDGDATEEAPPDEVEADPDAEPAEGAAELSMEGRAAALETLLETYHGAARNIFGEEWETADNCPQCSGLGFVFPTDLVKDPETEQCPQCAGHGVLITESQVPNNIAKQCPRCLGNGYIPKVVAPVVEFSQVPSTYVPPPPNAASGTAATVSIPPMPVYDPHAGVWRDPNTQEVLGSGQAANGAVDQVRPVPS